MIHTHRHRLLTALFILTLLFIPLGVAVGADSRAQGAGSSLTVPQLQAWPDPQNVSASPGVDSEAPALAATSAGVTHLVWEEGSTLYHSYSEGQNWSTPSSIPAIGTAEAPVLAATNGTVHLVYFHDTDTYYVSWDDASWSLPKNISDTEQASRTPDLAVGPEETLHVVWAEATGDIYYAQSTGDSPWSSSPIPNAEGSAPAVAVGADGSIQVVWQETIPLAEQPEIVYSRRVDTSWSLPEYVSTTPNGASTAPDLAVDSTGTAHVVWQEVISATTRIQYSNRTTIWTLSGEGTAAFAPCIAADAQDGVHVAWDTAFPYSIRYTWRTSEDDVWTAPASLTSNLSEPLLDVVLYTGPGIAVRAAWEQDGGEGEIFYAEKPLTPLFLPFVSKGATVGK